VSQSPRRKMPLIILIVVYENAVSADTGFNDAPSSRASSLTLTLAQMPLRLKTVQRLDLEGRSYLSGKITGPQKEFDSRLSND